MDALLIAGDREGVVELLFRGLEDMSDKDMAAWQPRRGGAVLPLRTPSPERSEVNSPHGWTRGMAGRIAAPMLLITGANSADPAKPYAEAVAQALPNAELMVLDDQAHVADVLDPELFARRVLPFLKKHP